MKWFMLRPDLCTWNQGQQTKKRFANDLALAQFPQPIVSTFPAASLDEKYHSLLFVAMLKLLRPFSAAFWPC
jgi:hypothetical protein